MGPVWSAAALLVVASLFLPTSPAEAPPDAFCVVVIQPLDDFRHVRILVDEELSDEARAESWMAADSDGDGNVTALEAGLFREAGLEFWRAGAGLGNRSAWLRPEEPFIIFQPLTPVYAATWRQLGHGFPGVSSGHGPVSYPIRNPDSLETQAIRDFVFQLAGDPTHLWIEGGRPAGLNAGTEPNLEYLPRAVIEYVVITAPPGWRIDTIQGYGYNGSFIQSELNLQMAEIPGFDTSAPWSIRYVNAAAVRRHVDENEIPGTSFVLLAFAILSAAGLRRQPR